MKSKEEIEERLELKRKERESQLRKMESDDNLSSVNMMFQTLTLDQIRVLEWVLRDDKPPVCKIK